MDPRREITDAVNLLANVAEAHTVALFVPSADGQHLRALAWHTLSKSFRAHEPIRLGEGLVGYVAKHGRVVDVDRYQQKATATRLYDEDEGIQAFLGMPVGDRGVLVVDIKKRPLFGEREKKVVKDFATFMGNLLAHEVTCFREALYGRILDLMYDVENAALGFQDARQYFGEVLDAGRRYTGLSMGFICLLHPGKRQFTVQAVEGPSVATLRGRSFPVSQGLVGWVLREAKSLAHSRLKPLKGKSYLISPDEPIRGYNAFIGVPLIAWRKLTGVWAFAGHTERQIEEEEERALQLAGHRVATSIEHYQLQ